MISIRLNALYSYGAVICSWISPGLDESSLITKNGLSKEKKKNTWRVLPFLYYVTLSVNFCVPLVVFACHTMVLNLDSVFCFLGFFVFLIFRAAPTAYGTSQARGPIRATAAGLTTATATPDPSHVFDLHHSSWQHWILNPLSEARDQTYILMDTSQVRYRWAMMGTPLVAFLT